MPRRIYRPTALGVRVRKAWVALARRVPGDIAGLIFAVGTILIVVVGLPGLQWFFVAAAFASGLVAWQRVRHPAPSVGR